MFYLFHNYVNAKKRKPLFNFGNLSVYQRYRLVPVVNNFILCYNTKGNMKLLNESFQRQFVIKDFKAWFLANIKAFFTPVNPPANIVSVIPPSVEVEEQELVEEEPAVEEEEQSSIVEEQELVKEEPVIEEEYAVKEEQHIVSEEQEPAIEEHHIVSEEQELVEEEPAIEEQHIVSEEQELVNQPLEQELVVSVSTKSKKKNKK
jgi:hypothetical protein